MDLRQLRQFVAVAEAGSFRRAAEQLCMAQPPLSVAIRKLEGEIGVPLLERSSRGVRLSAAGEAALAAARRCLRDADEVAGAARAAASGEAGRLRIGFIGSVTHALMPRLIQAFGQRYPQVKLELHEATNQQLLSAVASDALDLGFVRMPTARPPGVDFQWVQRDVFVAALPAQHPLARRRRLRLQDLADQPFIGYTPSRVGGLHAALMQLLMQAGVSPPITQEAVQVQTVIGLVESGLGLALVPSVNAPHASRRVVFRPLADLPAGHSIGIALAHRSAGESMVAVRFRELVTEQAGSGQPAAGAPAPAAPGQPPPRR
jgi:DNA-binding transcriptional LysR family regulator